MKRLIYPLLLILILTAGCDFINLTGNEPPVAYVDSISPPSAAAGETVAFVGHGTDADGTVVGYKWRSSIDGDLGTLATFDSSALSEGEHTIYLTVQDNNGEWSEEVESNIIVEAVSGELTEEGAFESEPGAPSETGTPTALPYISYFTAEPAIISPGGSSIISWDVSNAETVTVSYGMSVNAVPPVGTATARPAATTNYTLTADSGASTTSATVTVTVEGGAQSNTESYSEGEGEGETFYNQYSFSESDEESPSFGHLYGTALLIMDFPFVSAESGHISSDHKVSTKMVAGDSDTNKAYWAYFSFDISSLAGKQIEKAELLCAPSISGKPWPDLDSLGIFKVNYGPRSLKPSDFTSSGSMIAANLSKSALSAPINVTSQVQKAAATGAPRFQVRLNFTKNTDNDDKTDNISWAKATLRVQYR